MVKTRRAVNGKVFAKFMLNNIEEIKPMTSLNGSCISYVELRKYLGDTLRGYAWHIDDLEIFDEPKELSDFLVYSHTIDGVNEQNKSQKYKVLKHLTRAPQSWCYIEV